MASPTWLPLRYAWRNALAHRGATAVTLFGVSISVMVYVVMGATAASIGEVVASTGDPSNVVALSKGASSAESSSLDAPTVAALRFLPDVVRDGTGAPIASVELVAMRRVAVAGAPPDDPASQRYTSLRGVTQDAFRVHPGVRLVEGRLPEAPGEVLIGRLVPESLGPVGVGSTLPIGPDTYRVVGVVGARGQFFESEIWMSLEDLQSRRGRRQVSAVVLRTASPQAALALVERLEKSRRVSVSAQTEPDYYARLQRAATAFLWIGNGIGALMGLGAIVAGANTLYATMSSRIREMGTLRALGFGRWRVGASLFLESAIVAALGGVLGVALAFAFDGVGLTIVNLSFELRIDAASVARGLAMALAVGVVGGFLPARSAARLEIVAALRHV